MRGGYQFHVSVRWRRSCADCDGQLGRVVFRNELVVRFNYASTVPWVNRLDAGTLDAIAGPERLVLRTPAALHGDDAKILGELTLPPRKAN